MELSFEQYENRALEGCYKSLVRDRSFDSKMPFITQCITLMESFRVKNQNKHMPQLEYVPVNQN